MVRLDFTIPDYLGGPLPYGLDALSARVSLALAKAHVRGVESTAKADSPVRTGTLRDSVRARLAGVSSGTLEATAPYAQFLHEGTGVFGPRKTPIVIEPRNKKALSWPGAAHPVKRSRQSGIRPRDFLINSARMYFPFLLLFAIAVRMEVVAIFAKNYLKLKLAGYYLKQKNREKEKNGQELLEAENLDKYFHCKANCEAAQLGYMAEAVLLSDFKEWIDLNIDKPVFGDKQHTITGSIEDQLANRFGRARGGMEPASDCDGLCSHYRPHWLPEELW